ncbi:hypothetical protein EGI24_05425 [Lacihabitans sp. CS3-21]|nr:hypothetical protein [Lacihabitans sp. CS3-21]
MSMRRKKWEIEFYAVTTSVNNAFLILEIIRIHSDELLMTLFTSLNERMKDLKVIVNFAFLTPFMIFCKSIHTRKENTKISISKRVFFASFVKHKY